MAAIPENSKRLRSDKDSLDRFLDRCGAGLQVLYAASRLQSPCGPQDAWSVYRACVEYITGTLAVLIAAQRSGSSLAADAARALHTAAEEKQSSPAAYVESVRRLRDHSGMNIFAGCERLLVEDEAFASTARLLLGRGGDASMDGLYYQTMPLSWLGCAYQYLLAFSPSRSGDELEPNRAHRKGRGIYFTPPPLVTYIVQSVLGPITEDHSARLREVSEGLQSRIAVLDPAMGGGGFLSASVDYLSERGGFGDPQSSNAKSAAECVYGVDVDPAAVEIARFSVWAAAGFADGLSEIINSHLVCADVLADGTQAARFDWRRTFGEVFDEDPSGGFDAVIGNPPYIASKNGLTLDTARSGTSGQSDSYLLFLRSVLDSQLVKPGGRLAMVLPDPMLVRENASAVRGRLLREWSLEFLLHISGVFPEANVANVVPVCRRSANGQETLMAARIDRAEDRRLFAANPVRTAADLARPVRKETILAQRRCEFLYMLDEPRFAEVIRRIHGERCALSNYQPPYAPLEALNVRAIYRGEEVGKAAIDTEQGDVPVLLGGQSIRPYEIIWEGRRAAKSWVKKPLARYRRSKILIQKSSAHIIAAFDEVSETHPGYVFPQSVYAVELQESGMDELYLLCILNSEVMNSYIYRTVTGYKLLQPQLELEDIRALPIRRVSFTTPAARRQAEAAQALRIFEHESTSGARQFSGLANYTVSCLTANPEKSDVVHDLLVYLGRLTMDLTAANRRSPDAYTTSRLEAARTAVETVVWRLYSSQPTQMSLPL